MFCGESLYIFPMNLHPQFCTLHCPDKIKCNMHTQVMFCGEMTKETQNTLIQEFHIEEYSSSHRDKTHLNCFAPFFFFCFLWGFFSVIFFLVLSSCFVFQRYWWFLLASCSFYKNMFMRLWYHILFVTISSYLTDNSDKSPPFQWIMGCFVWPVSL